MNLQYSQFITRTVFCGDHVRQMIHANLDQIEEGSDVDDKIVVSRFFALKGAKVTSWCGDREKFLGRYHGYGNPAGVAEGTLCNEGNENGNSCGALSTVVRLAPGEHCEFAFLVGMKEEPEVAEILASYALPEQEAQARQWGHSTFGQSAALAAQAGAKRLWLTHYSPMITDPEEYAEQAQGIFPAAECGFDGKSITLQYEEVQP